MWFLVGGDILAHTNGLVVDGSYRYTGHLLALERCAPTGWSADRMVSTPLVADAWETGLSGHPDRLFVEFILRGIREGFRIGFKRAAPLGSASSNMPVPQAEVVQSYLTNEVSKNRMVQCDTADGQEIHVSPLGIIPKKNRPGKWRLIVDLSSPKGESVNDGINSDLCSLQYATVDMLAVLVLQVGRGAFLVKADIKEAYRNIPVHPDDRTTVGNSLGG